MKPLAENKKAYFDYEILDKIEAGVVLEGHEVKSVKLGRMSLDGSYAIVRQGELYLLNANVPPYQPLNNTQSYDPRRTRKLLLRKQELQKLYGETSQKGLTLLPLTVYTKNGFVKIELGLARHRKKGDKRELLKKRVTQREIERALKGVNVSTEN
jgi:SsrA-binding protein